MCYKQYQAFFFKFASNGQNALEELEGGGEGVIPCPHLKNVKFTLLALLNIKILKSSIYLIFLFENLIV